MKKDTTFIAIIIGLIAMVPLTFLNAHIILDIIKLYDIPIKVTKSHVVGIMIIISLLKVKGKSDDSHDGGDALLNMVNSIFMLLLGSLSVWGIGYLIHLFV